jgi:caffeoyl-CoA O-methyltransferase
MPAEKRPPLVFSVDVQTALIHYITEHFVQELPAQARINDVAADNNMPQIELRAEEGWLVYFLARLSQAKTAVEIGTLAGYSASWLARALPDDGKLYTLEVSAKHAQVARQNLEALNLAHKVEIIVGDARHSLAKLTGQYDLVFIDADKISYGYYLDWTLEHLAPGGLLMAHNAFRNADILKNPDSFDEIRRNELKVLLAFNQRIASDPRLTSMIIPLGDGLVAAVRNP